MTTQDIALYHKNKKKHPRYEDSVKYAKRNAIHILGEYPEAMIEERRPGESKKIRDYRKKIFAEITQTPCDKVQNELQKIRNSPDWMIRFDGEQPSVIAEGETLDDYMGKNFLGYTSFTNYFFSSVFQTYLVDAEALILWVPENMDKPDTEFYRPVPEIFLSWQKFDYSPGEWYVLKSTETITYVDSQRTFREGAVYYYVDKEVIIRYEQINAREQFKEAWTFTHELGRCPIVDLYGKVYKHIGKVPIHKSRISGMMPELDEALREYQDLQAEVVQHIHSTLWAYNAMECKVCRGAGNITQAEGAPLECYSCHGKGSVPFDPFEYLEIRPSSAGENQPPIPPIGYVDKKIDIAILQDKRVQEHVYRAYAAIGFEFLTTQLNQSGLAKEWDRSSANTFVKSIAEDVVRIFDDCYSINASYRYLNLVGEEKVKELMPYIPIPEKFDIVSEALLSEEIKKMRDADMDPMMIIPALKEYANKKYYTDENTRLLVQAALDINPFAGVSNDKLIGMLMNDGIDPVKYVVHCNIKDYLLTAIQTNKEFLTLPLDEMKKVIYAYAEADTKKFTKAAELEIKKMAELGNGGQ